jgi:hypothetical protein
MLFGKTVYSENRTKHVNVFVVSVGGVCVCVVIAVFLRVGTRSLPVTTFHSNGAYFLSLVLKLIECPVVRELSIVTEVCAGRPGFDSRQEQWFFSSTACPHRLQAPPTALSKDSFVSVRCPNRENCNLPSRSNSVFVTRAPIHVR